MDYSRHNRENREDPEGDQGPRSLDESPSDSDSLPSIGEYLARQRELRGISREDLCNRTQIPMRSLERLESGVFDQLDDGFVRGFVRTVAEALGLDPDDTLARMTQEPVTTHESTRAIATLGLMRAGVLFAGLALILISVGLVSVALKNIPSSDGDSPLVMRRDPVRALAEARVGPALDATQVLVPPPAPPVENPVPELAQPEQPAPEESPSADEILRARAPVPEP